MKESIKERVRFVQKKFNDEKLKKEIVRNSSSLLFLDINYTEFLKEYFKEENLDERCYFLVFNGCYEQTFIENGLGNISGIDEEKFKAIEFLEKELGKTEYFTGLKKEGVVSNFLTTNEKSLMYEAFKYCPERLWGGPLGCKDFGHSKIPIQIGETKPQYMMRIFESRIPKSVDDEKRKEILEAAQYISDVCGSKRPKIAVIPESEIEDYEVNFLITGSQETYKLKNFINYVKNGGKVVLDENVKLTYKDYSNFGLTVFGDITKDQFEIITVPDIFELTQMLGIQKGARLGDLINPYDGKPIKRGERLPIINKKNPFTNFLYNLLSKLREVKQDLEDDKIKTKTELNQKKKESFEFKIEDFNFEDFNFEDIDNIPINSLPLSELRKINKKLRDELNEKNYRIKGKRPKLLEEKES